MLRHNMYKNQQEHPVKKMLKLNSDGVTESLSGQSIVSHRTSCWDKPGLPNEGQSTLRWVESKAVMKPK